MHRYASQTPEARELVADLEFVWDQIKSNSLPPSPPTVSSQSLSSSGSMSQMNHYPQQLPQQAIVRAGGRRLGRTHSDHSGSSRGDSRLRVLSPVSQPDDSYQRQVMELRNRLGQVRGNANRDSEDDNMGQDDVKEEEVGEEEEEEREENDDEEEEQEEEEEEEEYEEARDSLHDNNEDGQLNQGRKSALLPEKEHGRALGDSDGDGDSKGARSRRDRDRDKGRNLRKWRRRVEQALTKMTAEMAAVREQMETRAIASRRRSSVLAWLKWLIWLTVREILWDLAILGLVLLWMRIKGDRRLEAKLMVWWTDVKTRLMELKGIRRRLPAVRIIPSLP